VKIFYVDAIEGGIKERENKSVGTKRSVMGENQPSSKFNRGVRQMFEDMEISVK